MNGDRGTHPEKRVLELHSMSGSLISGVSRGKTGWLADSMADLQLGIDGLRSQISAPTDGDWFARAVGALA